MRQRLDERYPSKHADASSSSKHDKTPRAPQNTRPPTNFLGQMANLLLESGEVPLLISEILIGEESSENNLGSDPESAVRYLFKRRRLTGKQPVPGSIIEKASPKEGTWKDVFQLANPDVPPKGRVFYDEGSDMMERIQALVPQYIARHAVFCRGTVRVQGARDDMDLNRIPLRKTMVVKRDTGEVVEDGPVEAWTKTPKYHRGRKGISARFSVTIFGSPKEEFRVEVPRVVGHEVASSSDVAHPIRGSEQASAEMANPRQTEVAVPSQEPANR